MIRYPTYVGTPPRVGSLLATGQCRAGLGSWGSGRYRIQSVLELLAFVEFSPLNVPFLASWHFSSILSGLSEG